MITLNVMAIILFIVVSLIVLVIESNDNYVISYDIRIFVYVILWLGLHEILHGIGFAIFRSVNNRNITFGLSLEKGVFYCMCKQEIERKVILTSLCMPVMIIGIVTLILGMIINSYILVLLSIMNIVGSIGDMAMIGYFLRVGDVRYLDLDDCTSFTVISNDDLSKIRIMGIELIDSGIYDSKKMVARDRRKLVISKPSYILFLIMIVILIIGFIGGI
jgi:hypothetical protein